MDYLDYVEWACLIFWQALKIVIIYLYVRSINREKEKYSDPVLFHSEEWCHFITIFVAQWTFQATPSILQFK